MESYHCSTTEPAQIKPAVLDTTATQSQLVWPASGEKVTFPLGGKTFCDQASHR